MARPRCRANHDVEGRLHGSESELRRQRGRGHVGIARHRPQVPADRQRRSRRSSRSGFVSSIGTRVLAEWPGPSSLNAGAGLSPRAWGRWCFRMNGKYRRSVFFALGVPDTYRPQGSVGTAEAARAPWRLRSGNSDSLISLYRR